MSNQTERNEEKKMLVAQVEKLFSANGLKIEKTLFEGHGADEYFSGVIIGGLLYSYSDGNLFVESDVIAFEKWDGGDFVGIVELSFS